MRAMGVGLGKVGAAGEAGVLSAGPRLSLPRRKKGGWRQFSRGDWMRAADINRNVGRNGRQEGLAANSTMRVVKAPPDSRSRREASFGSLRRVRLHAIVGSEVLPAIGCRPEDRLGIVGIRLGIVLAEQFALPGVRRRDLRRRRQLEARLVEVLARLHHLGPVPDRLVAWPRIRQTGREVRRRAGGKESFSGRGAKRVAGPREFFPG